MATLIHASVFEEFPPVSTGARWAGRGLSGMSAVALAADSLGKLTRAQAVIDGTVQLGYPADVVVGLWRRS